MASKKFTVRLTGRTPLVLHNNCCVDPLHPLKKEISAITGKKKKVDADYLQLRKLEFVAGLYHTAEMGPFVPSQNIRKMLIEAARKDKNGKQFESGIFIIEDAAIQYEGPRDIEGMLSMGDEFSWTTPCGNQQATIMRTRPRFSKWSIQFEVEIEDSIVSEDMLRTAVEKSQTQVGLCDGRAIGCGRFKAEFI